MTKNQVLENLRAERDKQIEFVEQLSANAVDEGRELGDAEIRNVEQAMERIKGIDAQMKPLTEFEALRASKEDTLSHFPAPMSGGGNVAFGGAQTESRSVSSLGRRHESPYADASQYWADMYTRSAPGMGQRATIAGERLSRAIANQTTTDTPGLMPHPLIGPVMDLIDANRPLMTSLGIRPLPNGQGKVFGRPKVTQHTLVGEQVTEKTELVSRQMKVSSIDFTRRTYGGVVDISRQDIDWSDPSAWQILIQDLADVYAQVTEQVVAEDFSAQVTQKVPAPAADADLKAWAKALYDAAALSYTGAKRLPNAMWCSLDMWATLGAVVDLGRLVFSNGADTGSGRVQDFSGRVLDLPRYVVPSLPPKSIIVGWTGGYEVYEQRVGLITAVEPRLFGVEVAYGGYMASGVMEASAFTRIGDAPGPLTGTAQEKNPPAADRRAVTATFDNSGTGKNVKVAWGDKAGTVDTSTSPTGTLDHTYVSADDGPIQIVMKDEAQPSRQAMAAIQQIPYTAVLHSPTLVGKAPAGQKGTVTVGRDSSTGLQLDWGDASAKANITTDGDMTHNYAAQATDKEYTVTMSGGSTGTKLPAPVKFTITGTG